VADSVPEAEWRETEAKARAVLRAAELVEEGF
jgi:anthranilate synthase component 1